MIDIELLRNKETKKDTIAALSRRGVHISDIKRIVAADTTWRHLTEKLEQIWAEKKHVSASIASASDTDRPILIAHMRERGVEEKRLEKNLAAATKKRERVWRQLPNIPLPDVTPGGEKDARVIAESAIKPKPQETNSRDYLTLMGENINMGRAAKVSGARFTYMTGNLAQLEFALVSYVLDILTKNGFTLVNPPLLVGEKAMAGMGYLDQQGDEVYKTQDDLYLVGTSEQTLGAMHMDEIISAEQLPLRYCAFSPCFRREAGSHGKDTKGILRLHQFNKVEMFSITTPEKSEEEHHSLLSRQREIMDALQLPYRVVQLAAGNLGSPSAKTYDIETWMGSEGKYRETHSASNTTDYQSRRLNIRYKTASGKTEKVYMLNGTAVATPRLLIAVIEHYQQDNGSVAIPTCLHPYLPFTVL